MYWRTASLVCIAGAIGLAVLLSVSALAGSGGLLAPPRIRFDHDGIAGSGLPWSWYARGPGEIRALGVLDLYYSLLLGAGAALAVSVLTLFSFAAAREREREVELSVRRAVGASRRLLLGSALLESGVLIAVILGVGMPLAQALSSASLRAWPGRLAGSSVVPSVAVVAAIIVAVLFGAALPILFSRRKQVLEASGAPLPLLIPATQLGLSLIVLTMAALLSGRTVSTAPLPELSSRNGAVLRIELPAATPLERSATYAAILAQLPGASLSSPGVIVGLGTTDVLRTGCISCPDGKSRAPDDLLSASHRLVTADTFRALDIRLVLGRLLPDRDRLGTAPVVVINRTLASKLPDPIGQSNRRQ
ncbi:MAG: FtsX-like permease family protein [Gemmatimonadota bacterium]